MTGSYSYRRSGLPGTRTAWTCTYTMDYLHTVGSGRTKASARLAAELAWFRVAA